MKKFLSVLMAAIMLLSVIGVFGVYAEDDFTLTAVEGTEGNAGEGLDKLFDGNTASKYCTMNNTAYVVMSLAEAKAINAYSITSAGDCEQRDPKDWTFSGSNDGETWTELDSRADEDFPQRNWTNTYYFENTTAYEYFRFEITANNGKDAYGYDILQLAEFAVSVSEPEEDTRVFVDKETVIKDDGRGVDQSPLFDGSTATKYCTKTQTPTVIFALTAERAVNTYTVTAANDWPSRSPKSWNFYGSADGSAWTLLDTRTNELFPGYYASSEYTFKNTEKYLWFKFEVTANGGNDYTQFSEFSVGVTELKSVVTKQDGFTVVDSTAPNSGSQTVDKAFDGNAESKYLTASPTAFITVFYETPVAINRMMLVNANDHSERFPASFTLSGSDDGEAWTTIGSKAEAAADAVFKAYTFDFENTTAYSYYKLEVLTVASGNYMHIADLGFYTVSEVTEEEEKNFTILAGSGKTAIGQKAKVDLSMINAESVFGFSVELTFDPAKLTFDSAAFSEAFPYSGVNITKEREGKVRLFGCTEIVSPITGDTSMASVFFNVTDPEKAVGSTYDVSVGFYNGQPAYSYENKKVLTITEVYTEDAQITLTEDPYSPYDLNRDGSCSIADVTALLDYLAGAADLPAGVSPDLNDDMICSIGDVTALLDYLSVIS